MCRRFIICSEDYLRSVLFSSCFFVTNFFHYFPSSITNLWSPTFIMTGSNWSNLSLASFAAVLNASREICDDILIQSPSNNFSAFAILEFLSSGNITIGFNDSTITSNVSRLCAYNISSNISEPLNLYGQASLYPPWLTYGGAAILIPVAAIGSALNGFIIRILSYATDRTAPDVIQMNVAICDALDGVLGMVAMVAASVVTSATTREKITMITALLFLMNITFEDLTTMLLLGLRTRQVSTKSKV